MADERCPSVMSPVHIHRLSATTALHRLTALTALYRLTALTALHRHSASTALQRLTAATALHCFTAHTPLHRLTAPTALHRLTTPTALHRHTAPTALHRLTAPTALHRLTAPTALQCQRQTQSSISIICTSKLLCQNIEISNAKIRRAPTFCHINKSRKHLTHSKFSKHENFTKFKPSETSHFHLVSILRIPVFDRMQKKTILSQFSA